MVRHREALTGILLRVLRASRDRLILSSLLGILCVIAWAENDLMEYRPAYLSMVPLDRQLSWIASLSAILFVCIVWQKFDSR